MAVAVQELAAAPDWHAVLDGGETSLFVDGPAAGTRTVGAVALDLAQATEDVNRAARGGPVEALYRLYAYGRLADLMPAARQSRIYVVVWVADLAGPEAREAGTPIVLSLVGRAYGPTGSRRSVALTVFRTPEENGPPGGLHIASWHDLH